MRRGLHGHSRPAAGAVGGSGGRDRRRSGPRRLWRRRELARPRRRPRPGLERERDETADRRGGRAARRPGRRRGRDRRRRSRPSWRAADPASACDDSVTERFLRRSYGDAAGCEAAQKAAKPANDAGVTEVVINPDSVAQALAHPRAASTTARSCAPSSSSTTRPGSSTRCARTSPSVPTTTQTSRARRPGSPTRNVSGGQTPRGWAPPERWKASISLGSMTSPATPITT